MPGVELTSYAGDGHVVVALHGELDITGAAGAEAAITVLIARGQCLVIDLSALDFLDCCSLSALSITMRCEVFTEPGEGSCSTYDSALPRPTP